MASAAPPVQDEHRPPADEKWQSGRLRTLCRDCGHPRSDHHAIYNAVASDYIYTHCHDDACGCEEFVENQAKPEPPRRLNVNNPPVDWDTRCKACGSSSAKHAHLGPECLAACEANWKMIDKLRRAGLINTVKV